MASLVTRALESASLSPSGSSPKGQFWAFRHPNPDAPPETYRFTRRAGNGWLLLLAASRQTGEILSFYVETEADQNSVREALKWMGIKGEVATDAEGPVLRLADGRVIRSQLVGGEKPKKR